MEKVQYCNNCGNVGHLYRQCRHPILSYGIFLINQVDDKDKIVMIERKDSLSYIEFMRGKYKSYKNLEYIRLLVSRFTIEERKRMKSHSFDELWKQLWIHTETINPRVKREYNQSKRNFSLLKQGFTFQNEEITLDKLLDEVKTEYHFNEWEIPKGRRNSNENNRDCAIREFQEETNIPFEKYELYTNLVPLVEEYTGVNDVRYKHVYYIGKLKEPCTLKINMDKKEQYTEVKDLQWLSREECLEKIRDYDTHKKKVINQLFAFLKECENNQFREE